eukprot:gene10049-11891_t
MEEVGGVNAPVAARILFDSAIKEVEVQRDQVAAEKEGLRKEVIALKDALMEEKKMSGIVVGQLQDAIIKSKRVHLVRNCPAARDLTNFASLGGSYYTYPD